MSEADRRTVALMAATLYAEESLGLDHEGAVGVARALLAEIDRQEAKAAYGE